MRPLALTFLVMLCLFAFNRPASQLLTTAQSSVTIVLGEAPALSPIRPLLGVNAGPAPVGEPGNPDLTAAYQLAGVTMVRSHDFYGPLDMTTMYPNQAADPGLASSYDFTASDQTFQAIISGGFEPYLRLGNSYNNSRPVTNKANFVRAGVEVIRHYRDAARWGKNYVRFVEVWNEPDNRQFWTGSREEFFDLFAQLVTALKAEFPDLNVGGPGLTPAGFLSPQGQNYTTGLLQYLQQRNVPLDFFSWHVYTTNPQDFTTGATFYRQQLDRFGFTATEQHLTEWNTQYREGTSDDPALRTGAKGAALMTAGWIALQNTEVTQSLFYRGNDPSLNLPTFYGMFFADGRPKSIGLAFQLWSQLVQHPTRMTSTTGSSTSLKVLAGRTTAGEYAVLIVNPTDAATSWQLDATALGGAPQGIQLQQVSDASTQLQTSNPVSLQSAIGAFATQLVTFSINDAPPPPAPKVTVLSPNGGERYKAGSTTDIRWTTENRDTVASHDLSLSTDGGQTFPGSIVTGLSAQSQSFAWTIPDVVTTAARIKVNVVSTLTVLVEDTSNASFEIFRESEPPDTVPPVVTNVSVGSGAKKVKRGQSVTITWQSSDNLGISVHSIRLSTDGGTTFPNLLATGLAGSLQSFSWTVATSLPKSKQALIQVEAGDAAGNTGRGTSQMFKVK